MSLISGIIDGITGGHAAGQAANAQVGAAQEAAGTVQKAAATGNQGLASATSAGQSQVLQAGQQAGQGVTLASILASLGVQGAAANGQDAINTAGTAGTLYLNPYAAAGTSAAQQLAAGLADGGEFRKDFTGVDLQTDPGYQFRLQQGQQALQRQQAAVGASQGGGALKQLNDYSQGMASSEYQNAFNRFMTSQQAHVQNLQASANAGQAAATQQGALGLQAATTAAGLGFSGAEYAGNAGMGAAQYAGNAGIQTNQYASTLGYTSADAQARYGNAAALYAGNTQLAAGQARANGILGKQNAYSGMYEGIGNTIDAGLGGYFGTPASGSTPATPGGGWSGGLKAIFGL